jgi:hypothetical protein
LASGFWMPFWSTTWMERAVSCDGPTSELAGPRSNCVWSAESLEIRVGHFDIGPSEVEFGRALHHGSRAAGPGFGGQLFHRPRFCCWTQVNRIRQLAKSMWSFTSVATWPDCSDVPCGRNRRVHGPLSLSSRTVMRDFILGPWQPTASVEECHLFDLGLFGLALSFRAV